MLGQGHHRVNDGGGATTIVVPLRAPILAVIIRLQSAGSRSRTCCATAPAIATGQTGSEKGRGGPLGDTMDEWNDEEDRPAKRGRFRLQLLWVWVFVVVLYFSWESATYRGLFAMIAEWEFDRLGQDLPTFNFVLLTMLCSWPALSILRRRRAREYMEQEEDQDVLFAHGGQTEEALARAYREQEQRRETTLALYAARDYTHYLFGFTAALWLAALASLLWTLTLPNSMENPRNYTPDSLHSQKPTEGAAQFNGTLRYGRIASFGRGILFARRTSLYAPLFPPQGTDGRIRYFVEFLPAERPDIRSGSIISHRQGVLVRSDLPGALIRLYRYLGYQPTPDYYVLYVSLLTMRWPYYIVAAQFLLGGLGFFGSALWQRRHLRKLQREVVRLNALHSRHDGLRAPVEA